MLIRVHTEADLRLAARVVKHRTKKARKKAFTGLAVCLLIGLIPFFLFSGPDSGAALLVIAFPVYFFAWSLAYAGQWLAIGSANRKALKLEALDTRPTQYVLTEERFGYERPGEELSIAWTLIGDVHERHDMWLIHRWDDSQVWYVPKIGMPEPDIEEFRDFLAHRHELIAAMYPQAS